MFFRRRRPPELQPPRPAWVTWLVIGAILFLFINSQNKQGPIHQSLETASKNLSPEKLFHAEDYKKIFPSTLRVKEVAPGQGVPVICGQEVKVIYQAFLANGTAIDDKADKDKPLVFRAGEGKTLPVFEQGVISMKPGSKRTLLAPADLAYGAQGFERADVPPGAQVRFDIELLSAAPELPYIEVSPFRIAVIASGSGAPVACGHPAKAHVTLWGLDGKKIFSTRDKSKEPVTFTPGKSEVFLGLEQGVIGMARGGARTLIVPPAFQKPMHGNAPAIEFPFPNQQTVLVDVESIP